MCRSILLLSKIAHQKWHDHPFSQRNMTKERAMGLGVGGDRSRGGGGGGGGGRGGGEGVDKT